MRTREIGLPPSPQCHCRSTPTPKPPNFGRGCRRILVQLTPARGPMWQPGKYAYITMGHSWDAEPSTNPEPGPPVNCTNTGGRGGFQTPDRWCAGLALTVERCPDKSHPCTSAAMRRLPASQPFSPVAARRDTQEPSGHKKCASSKPRKNLEQQLYLWARKGSNLRPLVCKTRALPLSYTPVPVQATRRGGAHPTRECCATAKIGPKTAVALQPARRQAQRGVSPEPTPALRSTPPGRVPRRAACTRRTGSPRSGR